MIYYLENLNSVILNDYFNLSNLFIQNTFGFKLLILSLFLFFLLFLKFNKKILNKILFIYGLVTYSAIYIITQKLTDESFLSFEMSYNYYHFNMFSFSPIENISASTDILFNLFISLFSYSRESLIICYHFINFILGFLTIIFIYKIINPKIFIIKILSVSFIVFYAPLIAIYSNFFPNTIIGFIFALSAYFLINNHKKSTILYSSAILFRVEGLIVTVMGFFIDFFINKKKNFFSLMLIPIFYLIYFNIHKYYLGFYYPTPLKFKSFGIDQISMLSKSDYYSMLVNFFNIFHILSFVILIFSIPILLKSNRNFKNKSEIFSKKFKILSLLFFFSLIAYFILEPTIFGVNFDTRYFVFTEIMLVLYPMYVLNKIYSDINAKQKLLYIPLGIIFLVISLAVLIPSNSYEEDIYAKKNKYIFNVYSKYEQLGVTHIVTSSARGAAGHAMGHLVPKDWKIAFHELNAFGYYNDLHLYDLWGYTNPEIAKSNQFASYRRQRNNPDFFWNEKIDILWAWSFDVNFWEQENFKINKFNDLKPYNGSNFTKNHNIVGDINFFFKNYDTFILRLDNYIIYLHVLKKNTDKFISILSDKNFKLKYSKKINLEKIFNDNEKDNSKFYIFKK